MNNASTGPDQQNLDPNKQFIDDASDRAFDPIYSSKNTEYSAELGSATVALNSTEQSLKYSQTSEQSNGSKTQSLGENSLRTSSALGLGKLSDAEAKTTTFNLEADAHTGQQQSLQTKLGDGKLTIEASVSAGQRMRYSLTLPGVDQPAEAATRINPLQPESLPIGARAVMDTQTYTQRDASASLQHLSMQSEITEASGRSYLIERVDERHVRVVTGPNAAIEAVNAVGVKVGPAQALLERADALGQSQVHSAQFDLADPRALAAMGDFVREGKIAPDVPGVDERQTLERISFSSQQRLQLELGPLSADLAGNRNEGSQVRISTPGQDGYTVVQQLQYGGNVPLAIVRQYDGNETERVQERSYRFEIDGDVAAPGLMQRLGGRNEASEEKAIAQNLNSALSGEMVGTGAIEAGAEDHAGIQRGADAGADGADPGQRRGQQDRRQLAELAGRRPQRPAAVARTLRDRNGPQRGRRALCVRRAAAAHCRRRRWKIRRPVAAHRHRSAAAPGRCGNRSLGSAPSGQSGPCAAEAMHRSGRATGDRARPRARCGQRAPGNGSPCHRARAWATARGPRGARP